MARKYRRDSMFRVWGKIFEDNRLIKDYMFKEESTDTRTHKVFRALDEMCVEFDLEKPIWLDSNIRDFKIHRKTRFRQDSFIETIDFDYFEFHVIEEDF